MLPGYHPCQVTTIRGLESASRAEAAEVLRQLKLDPSPEPSSSPSPTLALASALAPALALTPALALAPTRYSGS